MKKKRALITGITGQDGSYLAEFLINKGYEVYGFMRRTSTDPFARIEHLHVSGALKLIYGNMRDLPTIERAIEESDPHEIYNLAAQSHVGVSFLCPDETWDINYMGVERLLTVAYKHNKKIRIYQASTSEMFGSTPPPQSEKTVFAPVSPYAEAKLKAHHLIEEYRAQGYFAASGILFNHESPRRGKHFVTRKLTHAFAKMKYGMQDHVTVGNLDAERDWGFAGDYVRAMWMMLQEKKADTYVIATGEAHSVRQLIETVGSVIGMPIHWEGKGLKEVGKDEHGTIRVSIDKKFYRPREVDALQGDASKAKRKLGWKPEVSFEELVEMMVQADLRLIGGTQEYVQQ
ncbi:GDP-mannose 4,6-dehydratase [Candidatus Kaiserbacteria bacterium]|nr:GDP-mannose 4,6-dehydratase [Candidatus Kaiserbacteria bacterium]